MAVEKDLIKRDRNGILPVTNGHLIIAWLGGRLCFCTMTDAYAFVRPYAQTKKKSGMRVCKNYPIKHNSNFHQQCNTMHGPLVCIRVAVCYVVIGCVKTSEKITLYGRVVA